MGTAHGKEADRYAACLSIVSALSRAMRASRMSIVMDVHVVRLVVLVLYLAGASRYTDDVRIP